MTLYWLAWWALYLLAGQWTVCTYRAPGRHDPTAHLVLVALWPLVGLAMTLIDLPAAPRLPSGRAAGGPAAAASRPSRQRPGSSQTKGTPDAR